MALAQTTSFAVGWVIWISRHAIEAGCAVISTDLNALLSCVVAWCAQGLRVLVVKEQVGTPFVRFDVVYDGGGACYADRQTKATQWLIVEAVLT